MREQKGSTALFLYNSDSLAFLSCYFRFYFVCVNAPLGYKLFYVIPILYGITGFANDWPCSNVDLLAFIDWVDLGFNE